MRAFVVRALSAVVVPGTIVCAALAAGAMPAVAQEGGGTTGRFEVSVVGGTAHTSRLGRLQSEQWLEPFAGLRGDARLWEVGGGRLGISAMADYFSFGDRGMAPELCTGTCTLSSYAPPSRPLVPFHSSGGDLRLALGTTWQRPLLHGLRAELGGFAGTRRARFSTSIGEDGYGSSSAYRPMLGGEVGVSLQRGALVSGVGFQFASSVMDAGVRRSQNRVALRMGWALP